MGSVPSLTTTGDNDPEIVPVSYYRHYLYCDACGSFELDPWFAPDHWRSIEKTRKRLGMAALLALPIVALVAMVAWFAGGIYSPWQVLLAGLIVVVGLLIVREGLGSRIKAMGMRCRRCDSTYRYGSPFFTDRDANPRNLNITDVPRPLGSSPFARGKTVEEEPTKG